MRKLTIHLMGKLFTAARPAVFPFLAFIWISAWAQPPAKYWVQFTDKNGTPFSVNQPLDFLSQRAIDRRTNQGIPVVTGDLPLVPSYVAGVEATGATVLARSKWLNSVLVSLDDPAILPQIQALPYVSQVEFSGAFYKGWKDPAKPDKWKIHESLNPAGESAVSAGVVAKSTSDFDYGPSLNQIQMINADALHAFGFRGEGMMIAVIDAGFYMVDVLPVFDSLRNEGRLLGTRDFVNPGNNVFQESTHGMAVLSTMAGNSPGEIIGTAPKASYWLLRSEDDGSEYPVEMDYWVAAAEFADSLGVDVINSSLGYSWFDDNDLSYPYEAMDGNTTRVTRGADFAAGKGILVFTSAGNMGGSFWEHIIAPSDGDSVVCVGGVDAGGLYASFSSTGPSADGRIKPDLAVQGEGTIVCSAWGGVSPGNGTSFASPVLAGAAACLWQAHPYCSNMEIYLAMIESASQYPQPDNFLGYGIPDFLQADLALHRIPDTPAGESWSVFPNPASEHLTLSMFSPDYRYFCFEFIDEAGRMIRASDATLAHPGVNTFQLDIGHLHPGAYLLRISGKDHVRHLRWLKM